jgi:hypothetical protein
MAAQIEPKTFNRYTLAFKKNPGTNAYLCVRVTGSKPTLMTGNFDEFLSESHTGIAFAADYDANFGNIEEVMRRAIRARCAARYRP